MSCSGVDHSPSAMARQRGMADRGKGVTEKSRTGERKGLSRPSLTKRGVASRDADDQQELDRLLYDECRDRCSATAVRIYLEHGADPNSQFTLGNTALHNAASLGSAEVVGLLLQSGAQANLCNSSGQPPLHLASLARGKGRGGERVPGAQRRCLRLLLLHGAVLNHRDDEGATALHMAALFGDAPGVIEDLVDAGARVEAKYTPAGGRTALDLLEDVVSGSWDILPPAMCRADRLEARSACHRLLKAITTTNWTRQNLPGLPPFIRRRAFTAALCLRRKGLPPEVVSITLGLCRFTETRRTRQPQLSEAPRPRGSRAR